MENCRSNWNSNDDESDTDVSDDVRTITEFQAELELLELMKKEWVANNCMSDTLANKAHSTEQVHLSKRDNFSTEGAGLA